jgi:hypothetical protein
VADGRLDGWVWLRPPLAILVGGGWGRSEEYDLGVRPARAYVGGIGGAFAMRVSSRRRAQERERGRRRPAAGCSGLFDLLGSMALFLHSNGWTAQPLLLLDGSNISITCNQKTPRKLGKIGGSFCTAARDFTQRQCRCLHYQSHSCQYSFCIFLTQLHKLHTDQKPPDRVCARQEPFPLSTAHSRLKTSASL